MPLSCSAMPDRCASYAGGVAISSPRGRAVMVFSDTRGAAVTHRCTDICRLAQREEGYLASDGVGDLFWIGRKKMAPLRCADIGRDNHIVAIG